MLFGHMDDEAQFHVDDEAQFHVDDEAQFRMVVRADAGPGDAPDRTLHASTGSDRAGPARFYTGQQSSDKGPRHSICVMQSVLLDGVVPM